MKTCKGSEERYLLVGFYYLVEFRRKKGTPYLSYFWAKLLLTAFLV